MLRFHINEYISIPVKDKLSCVDEISLMVYINIQRHFSFDPTAFPQKQIMTGQKEDNLGGFLFAQIVL
jgi:hypothetical protein